MSIFTLLGAAFIVMKILGLIDWDWWLVTFPLWVGFVIGALLAFIECFFKK